MIKRLIELDDDLLAEAQRELHTAGVSDTVREALRQTIAAAARARQLAWLTDGGRPNWQTLTSGPSSGAEFVAVARFLVDTSAAARVHHQVMTDRLRP